MMWESCTGDGEKAAVILLVVHGAGGKGSPIMKGQSNTARSLRWPV